MTNLTPGSYTLSPGVYNLTVPGQPPPPPSKPLLAAMPNTASDASSDLAAGFGSCLLFGPGESGAPRGWLPNFGGTQFGFTPTALASGFLNQFLHFYCTNYFNQITPFIDWNDNADLNGHHWSDLLAQIGYAAATAKNLGCKGLYLDTEPYIVSGNVTPSWRPNGASNATVQSRGAAVGTAIKTAFPNASLVVYLSGNSMLPGLYLDVLDDFLVQPRASAGLVIEPFLAGLASSGLPITCLDSTFYKPPNVQGGPYGSDADHGWSRSLAATANGFASLALPPTASVAPFIWLDQGINLPFESLTDPATFRAFRPAIQGFYAVYQFTSSFFDYSPYAPL